MVGVARSQACRACRKKKKGCDLRFPKCGLCVRLNLPCGYDEKKWTFINRETESKARPGGSTQLPTPHNTSQALELLYPSLGLTALESLVVGEYWLRYLPQDEPGTVYIDGLQGAPWKHAVYELSSYDDAVSLTMRACAFMSLGRIDRKPEYVDHARRLYGQGLRETNAAIQDPARVKKDALLVACKLLGVYETARMDRSKGPTTQGMDWARHTEGMSQIIKMRGPSILEKRTGSLMFGDTQLVAIICGITSRKPNFMCLDGWPMSAATKLTSSSADGLGSPPRRKIREQLLLVMARIPSTLHEVDLVISADLTSLDTFAHGSGVLHRAIALAQQLRDWESDTLEQSATTRVTSQIPRSASPTTLLEISQEHGYGFLHMVSVYWAVSIVLYSSIRLLAAHLNRSLLAGHPHLHGAPDHPEADNWSSSSGSDREPSPPPLQLPPWINPRPLVSHIATIAPRFFRPAAGFWGPQIATVGIGAALSYLWAMKKIVPSTVAGDLNAATTTAAAAAAAGNGNSGTVAVGAAGTEDGAKLMALLRGPAAAGDFVRSLETTGRKMVYQPRRSQR